MVSFKPEYFDSQISVYCCHFSIAMLTSQNPEVLLFLKKRNPFKKDFLLPSSSRINTRKFKVLLTQSSQTRGLQKRNNPRTDKTEK